MPGLGGMSAFSDKSAPAYWNKGNFKGSVHLMRRCHRGRERDKGGQGESTSKGSRGNFSGRWGGGVNIKRGSTGRAFLPERLRRVSGAGVKGERKCVWNHA